MPTNAAVTEAYAAYLRARLAAEATAAGRDAIGALLDELELDADCRAELAALAAAPQDAA